MASERVAEPVQTKALEEKIADLNLEEKAAAVAETARESLDGVEGAPDFPAEVVEKDRNESVDYASEASKDGEEKPPHHPSSQEVQVAQKEMQQSPDEGAYVVPAVDHRSVTELGGGEKVVDVPTAVVHENVDPVDKLQQQQGKGLIQSVTGKITSSVRSVFSGFTGGKAGHHSEANTDESAK